MKNWDVTTESINLDNYHEVKLVLDSYFSIFNNYLSIFSLNFILNPF